METITLRIDDAAFAELERMAVDFYGYQSVIVEPKTGAVLQNPLSVRRFLKQVIRARLIDDMRAYRRGLAPTDVSDLETQIT